MCHKNDVIKVLPIFSFLLMFLFNHPIQAQASGNLYLDRGHHDRDSWYSEVVVGCDRYYYDAGVFYRGDPGHYVVTEAPVGAVVYSVPSGYERVDIDGVTYVRYGNVYYRPAGHRYEVVRIDRSREHGDRHEHNGDNRDERR